jgi:hypothetical protein
MHDPAAARREPFQPYATSHVLAYRPGEVNHCPGCGRCQWWLRNTTAQCAFCETALPVAS